MPQKDKCEEIPLPEFHQKQKFNLGRRMAFVLLASIFIGEFLIMMVVQSFRLQTGWFEASFDSLLLLVLTLPAVYFLVIRPLTILNAERKQAEEALRNSEAHLHTLVQTIPDLIWLKDKDGVYLSCNVQFERLVGAHQTEITGKTDYDLFEKEDAEFFRENDRKAMINGKSTKNEEWLTFKDDGRRVLVDVIKTPMYDSQGIFVGVLGIGHDITVRKRAEEALRESEENYRYLFANNPQPMWIFDLETLGFLEVNKAATDHYGYSKEEFMQMTLKDLRAVEDRSYFQNKTFRTDNSACPIGEYKHSKKNGEVIFVEISAHTVFYQGRKARHVLVHDITDRKRAESEITLKNEELIHAHAEKDKFFSIIAHDLRSPFSSFLGLTQVMAEELPNLTMAQVQEIAVSMKNSATNLHQLLENLLQWAQMQQGSIPFNPKKNRIISIS